VVNTSTEIVIDGKKYVITLVEEWGCNLGEDVFLSEEETVSPTEEIINGNDAVGLDDFNDNIDELVADLKEDWLQNSGDLHSKFIHAENGVLKHIYEQKNNEDEVVQIGGNSMNNNQPIELVSKQHGINTVGQCSDLEGKRLESKSKSSSCLKYKKRRIRMEFLLNILLAL